MTTTLALVRRKTKPIKPNIKTPAAEQTAANCCVCSVTSAGRLVNTPGEIENDPHQPAVAISVSGGYGAM